MSAVVDSASSDNLPCSRLSNEGSNCTGNSYPWLVCLSPRQGRHFYTSPINPHNFIPFSASLPDRRPSSTLNICPIPSVATSREAERENESIGPSRPPPAPCSKVYSVASSEIISGGQPIFPNFLFMFKSLESCCS
jgi:hypothetical protein